MPPTAEVTAEEVSLARSYPELFRVTGPLLSLVFRTEDVWQRHNQFIETAGVLNQGFPFSLMMIILLLFLQKQNLAFAVYLFGSVLSSKRLFRGPSTNDMKK